MRLRGWFVFAPLVGLVGLVGAELRLYRAIRLQAQRDEARPVDAIVVFGAAQYNGAPSPVFKARLDHALKLEEQGLATLIITTGGHGRDRRFTEAGVGRDYLIQRGAAASKIVAETHGETSAESARTVAALLRMHRATTCLAVSDGFHLYRLKLMLGTQGIAASGSPAPASPIESDPFQRTIYSLRETLLSTLWYLGWRG